MDANLILSATLEGYELAKAKLARLEADYQALAKLHNDLVTENKELKAKLAPAEDKPSDKPKKSKKS